MGEMIKMVVVLTVLSVVSGGSLSWLKDFTEPKIENQVMNLVKGPAIRQILSEADNDPVEDRFKIMDGDVERNVFVGVFGGAADTVVMESSASGYGDKIGMVVAINMVDETLRGIAVTTHKETPGLGDKVRSDWSDQFADKTATEDVKVVKGEPEGNEIKAISGATVSSKSVTKIVNKAIIEFRNALFEKKLENELEKKVSTN